MLNISRRFSYLVLEYYICLFTLINLPAYKNHPTTRHKQPVRFLKTQTIDFPKNLITPQYIST